MARDRESQGPQLRVRPSAAAVHMSVTLLTLDLQQLLPQPAAGMYLSPVLLKTEPEQNVTKTPALDTKRKMKQDLPM